MTSPELLPTNPLNKPLVVYLLGVAGSGKRTVGPELAGKLGCPYVDGLALLPWRDRAKFDAGHPLAKDVRQQWLQDVFDLALKRLETTPAGRPKRIVVAVAAVKKVHARFQAGGETAQQTIDAAYGGIPDDPRKDTVRLAYVYLKDDEVPHHGGATGWLKRTVERFLPGDHHKAEGEAAKGEPSSSGFSHAAGTGTLAARENLLILSLDRSSIGAGPIEPNKRTLADEIYSRLHLWLIGRL